MAESIKSQTINGVKWTAIEQFSTQVISFGLGVILARLLLPSDFGTIGVLAIFMAISQTFVDSGMGAALVRKPDLRDIDCTTVFYFNIAVAVCCYFILFLLSPYIADFFSMSILSPVVKIYCLTLVIGAFESVHISRLTIALNFKSLAKVNVCSSIISGIIGVILAYLGLGIWTLVWQSVLSRILHVLMIWVTLRWTPQLTFSIESFKELFGYGSKLLAGGILWQIYSNLTPIIIGKFYSAKDLGFYNRGVGLAQLPENTILGVLDKVVFPIFAKIQTDTERLIGIYRKYIKCTSMAIMFCMILFAALARPLVLVLLSDKWEECIIYLQIFIFCVLFDHVQKLNLSLLKVVGYSGLVLKLEVYKRIVSVCLILAAIPFGVIGICFSQVIYAQIALIFNTYYTGKKFGLGYWTQMKDFLPYVIMSVLACAPSYAITLIGLPNWVALLLGVVIAPTLYIVILKIKNDESYLEFVKPLITRFIHRW